MNDRIGYQDYISGANYIRNTYYYLIGGNGPYVFVEMFGWRRIGEFRQVNTLDELCECLDPTYNIMWNAYTPLIESE